jgi:hypothetical protein
MECVVVQRGAAVVDIMQVVEVEIGEEVGGDGEIGKRYAPSMWYHV